jgi:hypothetical protein
MDSSNRAGSGCDISSKRRELGSSYPHVWRQMIRSWQAPRRNDAVWLLYSANYLFNTGNVRWAVDPVLLSNRVPEVEILNVRQDLAGIDFILLTHTHGDHVDLALWSQLFGMQCHWIIPAHMLDFVSRYLPLEPVDYTVAVPGKDISIAGVTITPFAAPHYEYRVDGSRNHVDETGYQVRTVNGVYLLPGDIRTYNKEVLWPFPGVTAVFAHVFLGRSAALEQNPPLLQDFIDFYLSCHPQRILLTHLYEFAREDKDCWCTAHAEKVARVMRTVTDNIPITIPGWYEVIAL